MPKKKRGKKMNKKMYIVFYPKFTFVTFYTRNYKIAKKTFYSWKKAINFKKRIEFYSGMQCSLIALHCTEAGIFRTIQAEIQNKD